MQNGGMPPFIIWFGGVSSEHDASLKSFANLYRNYITENIHSADLRLVAYTNLDGKVLLTEFDPTKDATFYCRPHAPYSSMIDALKMLLDSGMFIFSLLHGQAGEDGHVQGMAGVLGLTGSFGSVVSASVGMSKLHGLRHVEGSRIGINIPETLEFYSGTFSIPKLLDAFEGKRIVIKPNSLGASLMTEVFQCTMDNAERIGTLIEQIFEYDRVALAQLHIDGIEYSCGCLERNGGVEALPLVRIATDRKFFGHAEKHKAGLATELLVATDTENQTEARIREVSAQLFKDLGLQHMARFDYILDGEGIYFLEVNPLPGLMANSLLPKMLSAVSLSITDLILIFHDNERRRPTLRTKLRYEIAD